MSRLEWSHAQSFLVAAEEGSFSAAARVLHTTQPTVGRHVAALEASLGVVLVVRGGRGLELTPTGLEVVEHVRAMGAEAERVTRIAAGQSLELDGPIVISAGEVVASHLLPPILGAIRRRHPGIQIEVLAENQVSDLGRREADIALRNFRPTDPELVAKKVRVDDGYFYATPAYLASLGEELTLETLAGADFITFDQRPAMRDLLVGFGVPLSPGGFPWVSSSQHVQWALVTQGSGVGVMLAEVGDADPRVVRVLPDVLHVPVPIWLTSHGEVRTSRRVRVVYDLLAAGLAREAVTPAGGSRGSGGRSRRPRPTG